MDDQLLDYLHIESDVFNTIVNEAIMQWFENMKTSREQLLYPIVLCYF